MLLGSFLISLAFSLLLDGIINEALLEDRKQRDAIEKQIEIGAIYR
jgi:hypothetical protein